MPRTSDEIELVGVASNRAEAIELVAAHAEFPVVVLTSFSDRERILAALDAGAAGYLLNDGDPDERIAMRLEISEKTVKAHLTRIYAQLGVSDRTEAALWAARRRQ